MRNRDGHDLLTNNDEEGDEDIKTDIISKHLREEPSRQEGYDDITSIISVAYYDHDDHVLLFYIFRRHKGAELKKCRTGTKQGHLLIWRN